MTSAIKEWTEENEQRLVVDFVALHREEFFKFVCSKLSIEDLMQEFANDHSEWVRYLECEYGGRGGE